MGSNYMTNPDGGRTRRWDMEVQKLRKPCVMRFQHDLEVVKLSIHEKYMCFFVNKRWLMIHASSSSEGLSGVFRAPFEDGSGGIVPLALETGAVHTQEVVFLIGYP